MERDVNAEVLVAFFLDSALKRTETLIGGNIYGCVEQKPMPRILLKYHFLHQNDVLGALNLGGIISSEGSVM
jgi:hypothetical protein